MFRPSFRRSSARSASSRRCFWHWSTASGKCLDIDIGSVRTVPDFDGEVREIPKASETVSFSALRYIVACKRQKQLFLPDGPRTTAYSFRPDGGR